MLRRVGSGLVGLSGLDLILPDDEVYGGPAEESFTVDGEYSNGGLHVLYDGPNGDDKFKVILSKGASTNLKNSGSSLGLGGAYDRSCVRASPGDDGGRMHLDFRSGTRHGRFNFDSIAEDVDVYIVGGQVRVLKREGMDCPTIAFSEHSDVYVKSGDAEFEIKGNSIKKKSGNRAVKCCIVPMGINVGFVINYNGSVVPYTRPDFPVPGEGRGRKKVRR